MIKIDINAKKILEKLNKNGFKAYVVGGCVRDSIMNIQPNDWDICTDALPDEIIKIFIENKQFLNGLKHGTVSVILNGCSYEITTFRIDGEYVNCRRPKCVKYTDDLVLDLSRRDFTMNAIAYSDEIIDPFNGVDDINKKIIKCVGNASIRFSEDGLRVLRALRFSSTINFEIDYQTSRYINVKYLECIAQERVWQELKKCLSGINFWKVYKNYNEFFCELLNIDICNVVIDEIDGYLDRLTVLLYFGNCYEFGFKGMNKKEIQYINNLLNLLHSGIKEKEIYILCNKFGREFIKNATKILRIINNYYKNNNIQLDSIYELLLDSSKVFENRELDVDGLDLISWGVEDYRKLNEIFNLCKVKINSGYCINSNNMIKYLLRDIKYIK